MKKILTFVLVFALIMSMSVSAFAAGAEAGNDELVGPLEESYTGTKDDKTTIDAYGILDTDGDGVPDDEDDDPYAATVISVDLEWTAMEFVYTPIHGSWDAGSLQYREEAGAFWADNVETITVTNKSNSDIIAGANFVDASEDYEWDLDIAVNTTSDANVKSESYTDATYEAAIKLISADDGITEDNKTGTATVGIFDVSMNDSSAGILVADTKLGTITVTIFKAPAATQNP